MKEFQLPRIKISLSIIRQFRAIKKITHNLGAIKIHQVRAMSYGYKRANTYLTRMTIVNGETKELTKELTITEMLEMKVENANVNIRLLTPSQVQIPAMRLRLRVSSLFRFRHV